MAPFEPLRILNLDLSRHLAESRFNLDQDQVFRNKICKQFCLKFCWQDFFTSEPSLTTTGSCRLGSPQVPSDIVLKCSSRLISANTICPFGSCHGHVAWIPPALHTHAGDGAGDWYPPLQATCTMLHPHALPVPVLYMADWTSIPGSKTEEEILGGRIRG